MSPWTVHFQVLDKSPVSGSGKGPPSCNKCNSGGDSLQQLTSWPLGVHRGQPACQWTRPSGRNWDLCVPGLLTRTIGQSAPTRKEQTLLASLPFPLLNLSYPPLFFLVPRSWTQESGQRASVWAEDWRLITCSWQRTRILVLISGRAEIQPSLLWRPREKSRKARVSAGGKRRL